MTKTPWQSNKFKLGLIMTTVNSPSTCDWKCDHMVEPAVMAVKTKDCILNSLERIRELVCVVEEEGPLQHLLSTLQEAVAYLVGGQPVSDSSVWVDSGNVRARDESMDVSIEGNVRNESEHMNVELRAGEESVRESVDESLRAGGESVSEDVDERTEEESVRESVDESLRAGGESVSEGVDERAEEESVSEGVDERAEEESVSEGVDERAEEESVSEGVDESVSEGVDERAEEESVRAWEESVSEGRSKRYYVENYRFAYTHIPGVPTSLPNTRDFLRLINAAAGNSIDQQASLLALVCGEDHSFTHSLDECVKLLLDHNSPLPTTPPLPLVLDIFSSLHQLAVRAHYVLGRLVRETCESTSENVFSVIATLCNGGEDMKLRHYRGLLQGCSCHKCRQELTWLDAPTGSQPGPCTYVAAAMALTVSNFTNLTPTFFRQVCKFYEKSSPLSHEYFFKSRQSPARVRQALPCLTSLTIPPTQPLPNPLRLLRGAVFPLSVEAIHYVDGDGGNLLAEAVSGLLEYLAPISNIEILQLTNGQHLVGFREESHDAIELTHTFTCGSANVRGLRKQELGVTALRRARHNIATSKKALLSTSGSVDSYGRLLVTVHLVRDGVSTTNGEDLVQQGLSVPFGEAPSSIKEAQRVAMEERRGLYSLSADMSALDLHPSEVRRQLLSSTEVRITIGSDICRITSQAGGSNEGHLMIRKSTIEGAGLGLFVHGAQSNLYIPDDKFLTYYSLRPLPRGHPPSNPDYELAVNSFVFGADHYDGTNLGRYANQGGLDEAMRELASQSTLVNYTQPDWKVVDQVAERHCNARFYRQGQSLCVGTSGTIHLSPTTPKELLVNYGIPNYWLPYLASKANTLPPQSPHLKFLLWALSNSNCNWPDTLKSTLTTLLSIAPQPNAQSPWPHLTDTPRGRRH